MTITLIRGGRLIDGKSDAEIAPGYVVFEGDRITAVGPLSELDTKLERRADRVIDGSGLTVLPGLVNAHEHLDDRRSFGAFQERVTRPAAMLLLGAARATLVSLTEGITTVRDCGGMANNPLYLKHAVELGVLVGPRIKTCISPICQSGGYGIPMTTPADGADQVRQRTRELLWRGADFIKCMASMGAAGARPGGPTGVQMSVAEMSAAFEEAHRSGKRTTVHAHPPEAIRQAIEAGVDAVEHALLIDDETANLMARSGTYLVSTLSEVLVTAEEGRAYRRPPLQVERTGKLLETALVNVRRAVRAGVKIAMGLDVLGDPVRELQLMVRVGMTPMQSLQAATRVGAEVLDMADSIGTLEVRKLADITLVEGNPLDDLAAVGRVKLVILGGRIIDGLALQSAIGNQLPGYLVDHGRVLAADEYR